MNKSLCGATVLRVVVGILFFAHGYQKVFKMGLPAVTGFFTQAGIPLPAIAAPVVAFVELLAGAAVVLGLLTHWAALLLAIDMLGAIVFVHFKNGFFLPTGYEFALTLLAATIALALMGPGEWALDSMLGKKSP